MNRATARPAAVQGYDPARAKLLAECCAWVYKLQDLNLPPPGGYQWVEMLRYREPWFIVFLKKAALWLAGRTNLLDKFVSLQAWDFDFKTPFGAVLESASREDVIVAFRGTQDASDVITDLSIRQAALPKSWHAEDPAFEHARVHAGFRKRAEKLRGQLKAAVQHLDHAKPCYVTGHSLGGAVAVLAAVILKHECGFKDVRMVSYAGPRVGDPAFAAAYDQSLTRSYRVVNDADLVPQVPLKHMRFWKILHVDYAHVGEKWTFLNQTDDLFSNHGIDKPRNYLAAAQNAIPSDRAWNFPVSSVHPMGPRHVADGGTGTADRDGAPWTASEAGKAKRRGKMGGGSSPATQAQSPRPVPRKKPVPKKAPRKKAAARSKGRKR